MTISLLLFKGYDIDMIVIIYYMCDYHNAEPLMEVQSMKGVTSSSQCRATNGHIV